jgi:hypothetical protein
MLFTNECLRKAYEQHLRSRVGRKEARNKIGYLKKEVSVVILKSLNGYIQ